MPILTTPRLILREITIADIALLARIYADPECMRHYPGTKTLAETQDWYRRLAFESYARDGFGLWAVVLAATGEIIGDCGITMQATPGGREPEIGYHLWRGHWGRGYATEAAAACRDHVLGPLGVSRVVSIVDPANTASMAVAGRVHQRMETYEKMTAAGEHVRRCMFVSASE